MYIVQNLVTSCFKTEYYPIFVLVEWSNAVFDAQSALKQATVITFVPLHHTFSGQICALKSTFQVISQVSQKMNIFLFIY